jgi:hypothetical protein
MLKPCGRTRSVEGKIRECSARLEAADGRVSASKTSTRSRRVPMVLVDESAQNIPEAHSWPGHRLRDQTGVGRLKVEAPMRSRLVVVLGVRAEDPS